MRRLAETAMETEREREGSPSPILASSLSFFLVTRRAVRLSPASRARDDALRATSRLRQPSQAGAATVGGKHTPPGRLALQAEREGGAPHSNRTKAWSGSAARAHRMRRAATSKGGGEGGLRPCCAHPPPPSAASALRQGVARLHVERGAAGEGDLAVEAAQLGAEEDLAPLHALHPRVAHRRRPQGHRHLRATPSPTAPAATHQRPRGAQARMRRRLRRTL
eukprot:scaffold1277_cov329-Prasinococcus_capsulatus_cf.AAC.2